MVCFPWHRNILEILRKSSGNKTSILWKRSSFSSVINRKQTITVFRQLKHGGKKGKDKDKDKEKDKDKDKTRKEKKGKEKKTIQLQTNPVSTVHSPFFLTSLIRPDRQLQNFVQFSKVEPLETQKLKALECKRS